MKAKSRAMRRVRLGGKWHPVRVLEVEGTELFCAFGPEGTMVGLSRTAWERRVKEETAEEVTR